VHKDFYMARFLFVCLALVLGFSVHAKDLPQGGFLLNGPVFPSLANDGRPLILAHAQIEGDQIQWTFVSDDSGAARSCKEHNKCKRLVQGPRHLVQWTNSGNITILSTHRAANVANAVISSDLDEQHIYRALDTLLNDASLKLTATGGTMNAKQGRRSAPRTITWHPLSLDDALTGHALADFYFEYLQIAETGQCVLKQFAQTVASSAATPAQTDMLNATRYYRELLDVQAHVRQYNGMPRNDLTTVLRPAQELMMNRHLALMTILREGAGLFPDATSDDATAGAEAKPPSAMEVLDRMHRLVHSAEGERLNTRSGGYLEHIITTRPRAYLAAIQFEQRLRQLDGSRANKLRAICADYTLGEN